MSESFLTLAARHAAISQEKFGPDALRGPRGPLRHLALEVAEALSAPDDPEEYADLLLLVLDSSRRAGIAPEVLLRTASRKLNKIARRAVPDWRTCPPDSPIEHIRDGGTA